MAYTSENTVKTILIDAVLCAASPTTAQLQQPDALKNAFLVCEDFKINVASNTEILLELLHSNQPHPVRLYGLQMVEYMISHIWNDLSIDIKGRLKSLCLDLIGQLLESDPCYLYEGVSRCVVEMVKREWPQQWPTFQDEMQGYCTGTQQSGVVMRIFRRLAEDVIEMDNIPSQRRKDILSALNDMLPTLIPFLVKSLSSNIQMFTNSNSSMTSQLDQSLLSLIRTTAETLSSYVGWCDQSIVTSHNNLLIKVLFENICMPSIGQICMECLLMITHRRGGVEALSPILVYFHAELMTILYNAVEIYERQASASEENYNMMKRLAQLITNMGSQLLTIWHKEEDKFSPPPTFSNYLGLLVRLTRNESLFICLMCFELWNSLFRLLNNKYPLDSKVLELSQICFIKLQKLGSPNGTGPASLLANLDYDSEAEWLTNFYIPADIVELKATVTLTLSHMKQLKEQELLNTINGLVETQLQLTVQMYSGDAVCDTKSLFFLEWEAINVFHHAICKDMTLITDQRSINLLQTLLESMKIVKDPQMLGVVLSACSAFLPVMVSLSDQIFIVMVERVFGLMQYPSGGFDRNHVIELMRHAAAIFIKLATAYPQRMIPMFEKLHTHILNSKSNLDSRSYRLLLEGLVIISQEMKDYTKQVQYIQIILKDSNDKWSDAKLRQAISSLGEMVEFIGLKSPDTGENSPYQKNRYQLQELLRDYILIPKRSLPPTDLQEAERGGFLSPNGVLNPSATVVLPVLDSVLLCMSTNLQMYNPEVKTLLHSSYELSKVLSLPEAERTLLLGFQLPEDHREVYKSTTTEYHVQKHVLEITDSSLQVIASLAKTCSTEFFQIENIAEKICTAFLPSIDNVHMYSLKLILRNGMKPLILHCPNEIRENVVLVLVQMIGRILARLNLQWEAVSNKANSRLTGVDSGKEEDPTEDEIIADELLRVASRELLAICQNIALESQSGSKQVAEDNQDGDAMLITEQNTDQQQQKTTPANERAIHSLLTQLDKDVLLNVLWMSCISCQWLDSITVLKSLEIISPLLLYAHSSGFLTNEITEVILRSLITSLHTSGQFPNVCQKLLTVILNLYEMRRFVDPCVPQIFCTIPGVTEEKVQKFDRDIKLTPLNEGKRTKPVNIRNKRNGIKDLLSDIIGKTISEKFKEQITIKDLPPLVRPKTKYSDLLSDTESETAGICQLFAPSQNVISNGIKL